MGIHKTELFPQLNKDVLMNIIMRTNTQFVMILKPLSYLNGNQQKMWFLVVLLITLLRLSFINVKLNCFNNVKIQQFNY